VKNLKLSLLALLAFPLAPARAELVYTLSKPVTSYWLPLVGRDHYGSGRRSYDEAEKAVSWFLAQYHLTSGPFWVRSDIPNPIYSEDTGALPMSKIDFKAPMKLQARFPRAGSSWMSIFVDLSVQHPSLLGALSDLESSTYVARYEAKLLACDGQPLRTRGEARSIEELVVEISELDFGQYMNCTLGLKLATTGPTPEAEMINVSEYAAKVARGYSTRWNLTKNFTANLEADGRLSVQMNAPILGEETNRSLPWGIVMPRSTEKLTLRVVDPAKVAAAKAAGEGAVSTFIDEIKGYASDLMLSVDPTITFEEQRALQTQALFARRASMTKAINELKAVLPEMALIDRVSLLHAVKLAYAVVSEAEAKIGGIREPSRRLNLDISIAR